jgi:hypothetical protein
MAEARDVNGASSTSWLEVRKFSGPLVIPDDEDLTFFVLFIHLFKSRLPESAISARKDRRSPKGSEVLMTISKASHVSL